LELYVCFMRGYEASKKNKLAILKIISSIIIRIVPLVFVYTYTLVYPLCRVYHISKIPYFTSNNLFRIAVSSYGPLSNACCIICGASVRCVLHTLHNAYDEIFYRS
jgi:hypothetical protein